MEFPFLGLRCRPSYLIRREEGTFPLESQSIVCCEARRYPHEWEWVEEYDCTTLSYIKFGWKLSVQEERAYLLQVSKVWLFFANNNIMLILHISCVFNLIVNFEFLFTLVIISLCLKAITFEQVYLYMLSINLIYWVQIKVHGIIIKFRGTLL